MTMPNRQSITILIVILLLLLLPAPVVGQSTATGTERNDPPVLAYYYIWFTPSSWNRAKVDIPLLGPYASDDATVMRQHIQWAKASGIDGFIVSWKHSEALTPRLDQLIDIARDEHFKLAIIYEGLDFYRAPLSVERISFDLSFFTATFAADPVFDLFERPLVIWSGTWKFSRDEIDLVTSEHRDSLMILASSKNAEEYETIADLVDGNAYYWSSVDPATYPDYPGKLERMRASVQETGGIWIAPVAPGFDARHIGGQREVPRHNGETLRTQYETALGSNPDAIGLISWNEFSENSHIEPSCLYGDRYLAVTAMLLGHTAPNVTLTCDEVALATAQAGSHVSSPVANATAPAAPLSVAPIDWDSSAPGGAADHGARLGTLTLLGMFGGLMAFSAVMITRRALHDESDGDRMQGPPSPMSPGGEHS